MINIKINEKEYCVEDDLTPHKLLEERKMKRGAVWLNGEQLLKKDYETTTFKDGDEVKVLRIMAGG
jgi:thiamine biosynthesis protein ThiS